MLTVQPDSIGTTVAVTIARFGEAFTLRAPHVRDDAAQDVATRLLLEAIIRKLDRFGARAFDIERAHRHRRHTEAIERYVGMVHHLTNEEGGLPSMQDCLRWLQGGLPLTAMLLGTPDHPGHEQRKAEAQELRTLVATLAERMAHPGPSCPVCMLPRHHALCTH